MNQSTAKSGLAQHPATAQDQLLHALGCVQAAHGCLQGSTIANAGIIADYLGDAATTIKGIIKEMPNEW